MSYVAYDYGDMIEIVTYDETGGQESSNSVDVDGDKDEALSSAGFERWGEWHMQNSVSEVVVGEI